RTEGFQVTPGLKPRPAAAGLNFSSGALVACAVVCLAAAVGLHANEDRWSPPAAVDTPDLLYVRSPAIAQRLALGHRGVGSDIYWIRALQHFGQERLSAPSHVRRYSLLYPL